MLDVRLHLVSVAFERSQSPRKTGEARKAGAKAATTSPVDRRRGEDEDLLRVRALIVWWREGRGVWQGILSASDVCASCLVQCFRVEGPLGPTFSCPVPVPPLTAVPLLLLAMPFALPQKPRAAILTLNNTRSYTRSRTSQHEVLSCSSRTSVSQLLQLGQSQLQETVPSDERQGQDSHLLPLHVHSFLFKS